jgi:DNA adenine methylase
VPVLTASASATSRPPLPTQAVLGPGTRPFLKWAGSKQRVRQAFLPLYPALAQVKGYHEPFLGSGAVFFDVNRRFDLVRCSLTDNNAELITTFQAVRDRVEAVIAELKKHRDRHAEDHYYEVRAVTPAKLKTMSVAERAARLIYLNKTCFNGLYRVNSKGIFNVPMGRYVDPPILDEGLLRASSQSLARVKDIAVASFETVVDRAKRGDLVYFDPPYVPVSATSYFTAYTEGSFGDDEQRALAQVYRDLDKKGCKVMLSNSNAQLVRDLYQGYTLKEVQARRNINSKGDRRGHVTEIVVLNYDPPA